MQPSAVSIALLAGWTALAPPASAEGPAGPVLALVEPASFYESFSGSGSRRPTAQQGSYKARALVALHLGRGEGRFVADQVQVSPKAAPQVSSYCVRFASGDARYLAYNPYRAVKQGQFGSVEVKSRFVAELAARYAASDMLIQVVVTPTCREDPDGPLVPAIPPGALTRDVLVAYVNAPGSRASVRLVLADKTSLEGTCRPATNAGAILYSEVCETPIGRPLAGATSLELSIIDGSARRSTFSYPVLMPI